MFTFSNSIDTIIDYQKNAENTSPTISSKSGKYGTPKGQVEKFETAFDAVKRETMEETGLLSERDFEFIPDFYCNVKYGVNNIRYGHEIKDIKSWLGEIKNESLQITISPEAMIQSFVLYH